MTNSMFSAVKTQYRVNRFSSVCLEKKVFVKSIKSGMMRFCASAQKEVNSKLWLVFPLPLFPEAAASRIWLKRVLLE